MRVPRFCGPSRSTLLYGQHTGHAPIRGNPKWTVDGKSPVMRADSTLLPKELKRAGIQPPYSGNGA